MLIHLTVKITLMEWKSIFADISKASNFKIF